MKATLMECQAGARGHDITRRQFVIAPWNDTVDLEVEIARADVAKVIIDNIQKDHSKKQKRT